MAWQRKIPFGYMIRGGILQPHPQEADVVRSIFEQYLIGASYLAIAEGMTRRGVRYHQHTAEWNKHMVKRILENTKYTGADGWPRLVSDEDFASAQRKKQERNTYAPLASPVRPVLGKITCACCGGRMVRGTRAHGKTYWRCQDAECGQSVAISDEILTQRVDERLRALTRFPHLLTAPEPLRVAPSMDAIRLRNELTMALNRGSEAPEYIKTLALKVAAQRYALLPDPTPAHRIDALRQRLEQCPADAGTLAELLASAVRAVRLTSEGKVELELTNSAIISVEKEAENP